MADLNESSKGNPHSLTEQLNLSLCGLFMLSPHHVPVPELMKVSELLKF